jgi:alpha-L-fucosidase
VETAVESWRLVDGFPALIIGFYHSLIDWHHPEFPIDGLHPQRDDPAYREQQRDISRYQQYLYGQVRELLTQFGRIDLMWFDFSYAHLDWGWSRGKGREEWQSERLAAMVRELQPGILINDRLGIGGDIRTPEQEGQNTTMAGLPAGTLTLELPVQPPPVVVPVVELFLRD